MSLTENGKTRAWAPNPKKKDGKELLWSRTEAMTIASASAARCLTDRKNAGRMPFEAQDKPALPLKMQ
jgi:hypothetical protein